VTERSARNGGSRFLYEPFEVANVRLDAHERLNEERWSALERRLARFETIMDRVEKRMWLAASGMAGVLAADIALKVLSAKF